MGPTDRADREDGEIRGIGRMRRIEKLGATKKIGFYEETLRNDRNHGRRRIW
jgi:hypothetical protein